MLPAKNIPDSEVVFGAKDVFALMPRMEEIPADYPDKRTWIQFVKKVFFVGLKGARLFPREGIDEGKALRHFRAILVSMEPSHEHKEAACAYLLSQWFTGWKEEEQAPSREQLTEKPSDEWREWYEKKVAPARRSRRAQEDDDTVNKLPTPEPQG